MDRLGKPKQQRSHAVAPEEPMAISAFNMSCAIDSGLQIIVIQSCLVLIAVRFWIKGEA